MVTAEEIASCAKSDSEITFGEIKNETFWALSGLWESYEGLLTSLWDPEKERNYFRLDFCNSELS